MCHQVLARWHRGGLTLEKDFKPENVVNNASLRLLLSVLCVCVEGCGFEIGRAHV